MDNDELVKRLNVKLTNASIGDRMYERPVSWEEADALLDLIEQQAARILKLEAALSALLEDTQHKDHDCGDEEWCPVLAARAALENTDGQ